MKERISEWHRPLLGSLPVIAIFFAQRVMDPGTVQLWGLLITFIPSVIFIAAYIPEKPHRNWLGTSLMLLAFGVISVVVAAGAVRIWGRDFPILPLLVALWIGYMFSSMVSRTWVLLNAQRHRREGFGWWLYIHLWPSKEPTP